MLSVKKSCKLIPRKNSFHFQVCQCRIFRKDSWPRKLNSLLLCRCQERPCSSKQSYETERFFSPLGNTFSSWCWYLNKLEFPRNVSVSLFFVTVWCSCLTTQETALYKGNFKVQLQSPIPPNWEKKSKLELTYVSFLKGGILNVLRVLILRNSRIIPWLEILYGTAFIECGASCWSRLTGRLFNRQLLLLAYLP